MRVAPRPFPSDPALLAAVVRAREADDATTILLGGTSGRLREGELLRAALLGELLAPRPAFGGFLVQQNRLLGGTAPVAQRPDRDGVFVRTALNAQDLADPNRVGRLGAMAADMDLAAGDRFGRQGARLEKARGPQPLVEPDSTFGVRGGGSPLSVARRGHGARGRRRPAALAFR